MSHEAHDPNLDKEHPFHLVPESPWPLLSSLAVLVLAIGSVLWMHGIDKIVFFVGLVGLLYTFYGWWRDVIYESHVPGLHTKEVQNGLRGGMILFIASEVMFFVAFFWGYFHMAFNLAGVEDFVWPPENIQTIDPFHLPYFNTLILLLSGTCVTWAHHALMHNNNPDLVRGLALTVGLGAFFTLIQGIEYAVAPFGLADGSYASAFYLATGFHGFHVIVGTIYLAVCLVRAMRHHFTSDHHVGFETAAWYWHFVDVVWLFLFVAIYWAGHRPEA